MRRNICKSMNNCTINRHKYAFFTSKPYEIAEKNLCILYFIGVYDFKICILSEFRPILLKTPG